jgi:hypothetical protein
MLTPTTRHSVATAWLARSVATKANLVTRSPGRKSGSFPEDLDLLFKPLDLAPEPLGLGLFGFAGSEHLSGAGCELLVAPLAEMPRAHIQFSGAAAMSASGLPLSIRRSRSDPKVGRALPPGLLTRLPFAASLGPARGAA